MSTPISKTQPRGAYDMYVVLWVVQGCSLRSSSPPVPFTF
jgi:hypothetical protein